MLRLFFSSPICLLLLVSCDHSVDFCTPGTHWNGRTCAPNDSEGDVYIPDATEEDTGTPEEDTGNPEEDTGNPEEDTGNPEEDTGLQDDPGPIDDSYRTGRACDSHSDCGIEEPIHMCATDLAGFIFPGGYCTIDGCYSTGTQCPSGTRCYEIRVPSGGYMDICMQNCLHDDDCRVNDGYRCWENVCQP